MNEEFKGKFGLRNSFFEYINKCDNKFSEPTYLNRKIKNDVSSLKDANDLCT